MKVLLLLFFMFAVPCGLLSQHPHYDKTGPGFLVFHEIRTDHSGNIQPWSGASNGEAYEKIIHLVWNFWDSMRMDLNGLPYYMNHQVWVPKPNDIRGIGGDQFAMAVSSWRLLYQFSGNESVKENMQFIADYYLSHSLSPDSARWPHIPFPYNTLLYSGFYDGDMVEGKGIAQPDKAGSLAWELIGLYKQTSKQYGYWKTPQRYLNAAVQIANTLALHTQAGNEKESPLPFKVDVFTGRTAVLSVPDTKTSYDQYAEYTTNWSATLELFDELIHLGRGDTISYRRAFDRILKWMKTYPLKNNQWGPFFEDVSGYSNTQINAITFARYILEHRGLFPDWKNNVNGIFNWVYEKLGNHTWNAYGVTVVNEQSTYPVPGNSHTAREGATELLYVALSGDSSRKENAIRQLNWSTYCVDNDGKNNFPTDDVWLTDGYGDFVRHYLRAMACMPELAPSSENHILSSTSVICTVHYINESGIDYLSFDSLGTETIRLLKKPVTVLLDKKELTESNMLNQENWSWKTLKTGGVLTIRRLHGAEVSIH